MMIESISPPNPIVRSLAAKWRPRLRQTRVRLALPVAPGSALFFGLGAPLTRPNLGGSLAKNGENGREFPQNGERHPPESPAGSSGDREQALAW